MKLCSITKSNMSFFLPLGTEDTFYEMQLPGHYGIGVVTGERPDYLAIGLLTFHVVERDRLDESYAVIDRICVAEDYRIRNFGRSLMNELLYNLREMKVESVFMDLPESGFDAFALFLAAPSGRLILDYFGGADEVSCEVMRMVMSDAISMALLKYKRKTMLEIPVKIREEQ